MSSASRSRNAAGTTVAFLALFALSSLPAASAGSEAAPRAVLSTPPPFAIHTWQGDARDVENARGRLTLGGRPVAGAALSVAGYALTTNAQGRFVYPLDRTVIGRYPIRVVDASHARVQGRPLSGSERQGVAQAHGAITVAYRIGGLSVRTQQNGSVLVRGRLSFANGSPPPKVVLYGYRLYGHVRDARGRPVAGAIVSTRSQDAEQSTFSAPTAAGGAYTAFYNPVGTEPVSLSVAVGDRTWQLPGLLHLRHFGSTRLDIALPASGSTLARPSPIPTSGAVYDGTLIGAEVDGRPVRPLSARWPGANGAFQLVLPRSARGQHLTFFEAQAFYLAPLGTSPGGRVPPRTFPSRLGSGVPQGLHANPSSRSAQ
jgi:hypothetical protein